MYMTDRRQTDKRQTKASLDASTLWGKGIIIRTKLKSKITERNVDQTSVAIP